MLSLLLKMLAEVLLKHYCFITDGRNIFDRNIVAFDRHIAAVWWNIAAVNLQLHSAQIWIHSERCLSVSACFRVTSLDLLVLTLKIPTALSALHYLPAVCLGVSNMYMTVCICVCTDFRLITPVIAELLQNTEHRLPIDSAPLGFIDSDNREKLEEICSRFKRVRETRKAQQKLLCMGTSLCTIFILQSTSFKYCCCRKRCFTVSWNIIFINIVLLWPQMLFIVA